jgi:hypothetical protein
MSRLLISAVATLILGVSPVLAQEDKHAEAANGDAWYDALGEGAIPGEELYKKHAHVEEELEKLGAAPRPEAAPLGQSVGDN